MCCEALDSQSLAMEELGYVMNRSDLLEAMFHVVVSFHVQSNLLFEVVLFM